MPDQPPSPAESRLSALFAAHPVRVGLACLRAVAELARARLVLVRLTPADIAARNSRAARLARPSQASRPGDEQVVTLVAQIVPRLAPWLPWRSDCLVQALGAQNWLVHQGVMTQIVIGADHSTTAGFEAHAWLKYGEQVVTGGTIARYTVLLAPDGAQD